MGFVFSRLWGLFVSKPKCRILMVGLYGAGKTTVFYKLRLGELVTTNPTIGFTVETVDCQTIALTMWDICRHYKDKPLWRHYYQHTQAIVFVVDSSDRDRLEEARAELHDLLQEDLLRDAAVLVLANKQDLPSVMTAAELREKLELDQLHCKNWYLQSACATTGDGLLEGFDWLSRAVASNK